jgi:protein phosphatase
MALQSALVAANQLLAETVFEHPELTGMGTTVSAFIRVGDSIAMAHIGDSRIYLMRERELTQITIDHTFVQRLVDSGRITPEEAATHPRRSVLMRVLGDIDAAPEIDTAVMATLAGDRWMICSDGLSSYVGEDRIRSIMGDNIPPADVADRLVKEALEHGAPDNVTVIVVDIDPFSSDAAAAPVPVTVGSAAAPLEFDSDNGRRIKVPNMLLHPIKATVVARDSHFEPETEDYLDALIAEDRRRARTRRVTWLVVIGGIVLAILIAVIVGYNWTQSRFYVGANGGHVAIYKGVQQSVGPIQLSSVFQDTDLSVSDLAVYDRTQVEKTINAGSVSDAFAIVTSLEQRSGSGTTR